MVGWLSLGDGWSRTPAIGEGVWSRNGRLGDGLVKGKAWRNGVVQKIIGGGVLRNSVREHILVKGHVARDVYFARCGVETSIPTKVWWIPEKDAPDGTGM